jgi:hypothetical protein
VAALIPYTKNPRTHSDAQIAQIAASVKEFSFTNPLLIDESNEVIAGHGRLLAARQLGMESVPCIRLSHLSKTQRKALIIADNKLALNAGWDDSLLSLELADLKLDGFDLDLIGFDADELAALESIGDGTEGLTDEDAVPETPADPVTQPGDLFILGKHRLLCGDSTSVDAVERLMDGQKADMVFTDPPYGINIVKRTSGSNAGVVVGAKPYGKQGIVGGGGSAGAMYPYGGATKSGGGGATIVKPKLYAPVINDEGTGTAEAFYHCALASGIANFLIFGGNYFTAFLPASPCWAIWDKQNSGNFADVEMAWTSFDRGAKLYSFMWNGLSRQGDRKTELATRVHPTQKPVGLIEKIFADFPFDSYFDGFLGSGSTLIACEKTNRSCYGMELSPDYCDVIVRRWQAFSGKTATLDGDGRTFDEIASQRTGAVSKPKEALANSAKPKKKAVSKHASPKQKNKAKAAR